MSGSIFSYFSFILIAVTLPLVFAHFCTLGITFIDMHRVSTFSRDTYKGERRGEVWYEDKKPKKLRQKWYYGASWCFSVCLLSLALIPSISVLSRAGRENTLAQSIFQANVTIAETISVVLFMVIVFVLMFISILPFARTNLSLPASKVKNSLAIATLSLFIPIFHNLLFGIAWS